MNSYDPCPRQRKPIPAALRLFAGLAIAFSATSASAQVLQPPFDADYSAVNLGSVPSVPTNYGGLTVKIDDPNTLLIGGAANTGSGAIYSIALVRGAGNHITGFSGTASLFSEGPNNDGGVAYGPNGVLFLTRYPSNDMGEVKLGSAVTDKLVDLDPIGVASSVGGLGFVPAGFPGEGQLKIVSYNTGRWYTVPLTPDGAGTFDAGTAVLSPTLVGGPEGIAYVRLGSSQFANPSVLISEYGGGRISAYEVDANGDPVVATRRDFITGLTGAEGATIDPLTGDFLFSTYGGGNKVIAVRGFANPVCGNGIIDFGEECDDGNTDDGDCCSSTCQFEAADSSCGLCSQCDDAGHCSVIPGDDAACGTIDCDGLDTVCRDYADLTGGRCAGLGLCHTANGAGCTSFTDLDGNACEDGNACTANDTCSGGTCTSGPIDPVCGVDNFFCYKATPAKAPKGQPAYPAFTPDLGAVVVDQFSSAAPSDQHKLDLSKTVGLCNPADRDGTGAGAPAHAAHLAAYQARISLTDPKQPKFAKVVKTIQNALGTLKLSLTGVDRLLVPSSKAPGDGGAPPLGAASLDHFKCYKAKVAKAPTGQPPFPTFTPLQVSVTDQFRGPIVYDLKKPTRLCAPADRDGTEPDAPLHATHLVCYQASLAKTDPKQAKFAKTRVSTKNALADEVLDAKSVLELCVPSEKLD